MDEDLNDADLWEELVRQGVPKDQATARVRARQVQTAVKSVGEGRSWDAPKVNPVANALRAFNQGATLGFSDELEGLISGAAALVPGGRSPGQAYREDADTARRELSTFRNQHPAAAPAIELAGGFATGNALARGASSAGSRVAGRAANPNVQRIVDAVRSVSKQPVAQGAATGAIAGAGSAEGGLAERAQGAAIGGTLGGVVGGVLQGVGAVRGADARAKGQVAGVLESGGIDLADAAAKARSGDMLLDVAGPQMLKKARALESFPTEGSDRIRGALMARDEAAPGRVMDSLQRNTGHSFENAVETSADLIAKRKANAAPLYEAAYAAEPIRDAEILKVFEIPAFRSALERAQRIAQAEGVDLPLPSAENGISVRALDLTKRGLDDLIESQMRGGAMGRTEARALRNRLAAVLEKADAAVPEYGAARQQFAGDSALEQAFTEAQEEFLGMDPREIAAKLSTMTEGEVDFYRRGAMDALRRKMSKTADGRDLTKVLDGNDEMRQRVSLLFGDEGALSRFSGEMDSLRGQKDNMQFVLGGSPTARIQAEQAALAGQPWRIGDVLHPLRTVEKAIDKGVAGAQAGATSSTIDRMAPMLTAQGDDLKKLVAVLEEFGRKEQARKQLTGRTARALGVPIGLSSGRGDR